MPANINKSYVLEICTMFILNWKYSNHMIWLLNVEDNKMRNFESNVYDCPSESYLCDKDAITVDNLN